MQTEWAETKGKSAHSATKMDKKFSMSIDWQNTEYIILRVVCNDTELRAKTSVSLQLSRYVSNKMKNRLGQILAQCNMNEGAMNDENNVSHRWGNPQHDRSTYNHDNNPNHDGKNAQYAKAD